MTDDHLAELLTLDAVMAADYWNAVLDAVRDSAIGVSGAVRRVVDLGSGTGNGARGLAARFPGAEIVAIDSDEELLAALAASDERIRPVHADLDEGWPALSDVDVTFASMSLHHLGDPERTLGELFAATRPGGVVAAAEFRDPLRVLRDGYGDDLEGRALSAARHGHPLPELHADWAARLRAAGFEIVVERRFTIDRPAPLDGPARRYAELWLSRLGHGAGDALTPADRDALEQVVSGRAGDALHLHGERFLTIGRRP